MLRFLILFLALAFVGLAILPMEFMHPAKDLFCLGLAQVSWWVIHPFDNSITLVGAVLRHGTSGFALEVATECSALQISWLFVVAVLTYAAPWRYKLWSLPLGVLAIQCLNVARLISLVYLGDLIKLDWFYIVHESVWPILLHLFALLTFVIFMWLAMKAQLETTTQPHAS